MCLFSSLAGMIINIILLWISVSVKIGCFPRPFLEARVIVFSYKSLKWPS